MIYKQKNSIILAIMQHPCSPILLRIAELYPPDVRTMCGTDQNWYLFYTGHDGTSITLGSAYYEKISGYVIYYRIGDDPPVNIMIEMREAKFEYNKSNLKERIIDYICENFCNNIN